MFVSEQQPMISNQSNDNMAVNSMQRLSLSSADQGQTSNETIETQESSISTTTENPLQLISIEEGSQTITMDKV